MKEEGWKVSISFVCKVLNIPRSTYYYVHQRRARPKMDERIVGMIWEIIEENPGYRIRKVWAVLRFGKGVVVNRKKVAMYRLESIEEAEREIGLWVEKYNTERPHEASGWLTPVEWRKQSEQAA